MFQKKKKKDFKKLAGLWLVDEVVNHVGIYGSKAAEGLSAFQRRSCLISYFVLARTTTVTDSEVTSDCIAVRYI